MNHQTDTMDRSNLLALSSRDAARSLGISERTLWTYTKSGDIPHVRLGRRILYPLNELRDWMRRTMSGGNTSGIPPIG